MATPLTGGWMVAFFLTGLATLVPCGPRPDRAGRDFALGVQLIPYVPVFVALIILGRSAATADTFVLVVAALLLIFVSIRQVMIVYENVTLTRDLEAKVAARTAELNTLGSIVTSSSDAIAGVSLEGVVVAWNPAAEQLYGHRAEDVIDRAPAYLLDGWSEGAARSCAQARNGQELGSYEVTWQRPDDSSVPIPMTVSPIMDGDVVTGISVFGRDVTEQHARRGRFGAGAPGGAGVLPAQVGVSGHHEPRDSHADERCHRFDRTATGD